MIGGKIRIVIAGEKCDRCATRAREGFDFGATFGGVVGMRSRTRIERVAVENHAGRAIEQRANLPDLAHAARAIAVMDIGKNTDDFGRHAMANETGSARGAN